MKTAEEYQHIWIDDCTPTTELFSQIQKDAWNEAIRAAAENAKTKNTQTVMYANQTNSYVRGGIEVDKDSILKLLKK